MMDEPTTIPVLNPKFAVEAIPGGALRWLHDEIDRWFDHYSVNRSPRSIFAFPGMPRHISPAVELTHKEDGYQLAIEVPGMDEKDVDIELVDGSLIISGEKHEAQEADAPEYLICERSYGAFRRRVKLPDDVNPDSLRAQMRHGVLWLDMTKDKHAKPQSRKIAIG